MSKRSSSPEAEHPRKKGGDSTNLEPLTQILVQQVFGGRPQAYNTKAAQYIAGLAKEDAPTPAYAAFKLHMKTGSPRTTSNVTDSTWAKIVQYFSNDESDHSAIKELIDVAPLVMAFRSISSSELPPPPPKTPTPLAASYPAGDTSLAPVSTGSTSSASNSSKSSGGSSSSRQKASPGQIISMRCLFRKNFEDFKGDGWVLPSGITFDECLREAVEGLTYESPLHSFIVEDVEAVLKLLRDPRDREVVESTMVGRNGERSPSLSPAELDYLQKYRMGPKDLHEFLLDHTYNSVGNGLQEQPSEEFRILAHDCIVYVLRTYQRNNYAFPREPSEAWFNYHLWGFLPFALSCYPLFEYKPGEVTSESSAQRRRKQSARDSRQQTGHKTDGMVVGLKRPVEMCWVEAARKDGGANTTKSLHDCKKLMKFMKDGHDSIREQSTQDIRQQLVTFGLQISGPSGSIFALRQRQGRFYQATEEEKFSFPLVWSDEEETEQILAVIERVFELRAALKAMTQSVNTWTKLTLRRTESSGQDWIAPTMTSPELLPVTPIGPTTPIPPLSI